MTTQQLLVPSNATLKRNVMDYSLIVVGSFLQALSYVLFLAPYKIVPGGVYGISIVIHYVTKDLFPFFPDGLPMGATALCFNIPLMILAMKKIGLSSGPKTIVTFLLYLPTHYLISLPIHWWRTMPLSPPFTVELF